MYGHKRKQSLANKQGKEQATYGSCSFVLYTATVAFLLLK